MTKGTATVIIGGIATQALAILCWYGAFQLLGTDLLKFWFNVILPFGALMLGFLGASGFWLAGRAANASATPRLALAATVIAIVAVFAIRFLGYWVLEFGGIPVHRIIGFGTYLSETLGHARMDFSRGTRTMGSVDLGALGYLMELLQTAAYAVSSWGLVMRLPRAVRCEPCDRWMEEGESGTLLYNDTHFRAVYEGLPAAGADRFAALRGARSDDDAPTGGVIRFSWRAVECPECGNAALAETGAVHNGQYFAPVALLTRLTRFDRRRASPPPPAPEAAMPAGARTFGRRTAP